VFFEDVKMAMTKQGDPQLKVRLDPVLHAWLKQQAELHDRSMVYLINQAIKAFKQQREL
jgi:predicted transcriptional regulator